MLEAKPSVTALRVAAHRAAHQRLENGAIFNDPYAVRVLGDDADALIERAAADPSMRTMRMMFAARSRYAEDAIGHAVERGTRQIIILGAGLDTFALRNPYQDRGVRIFEVDHPATQRWKRDRLHDLGLNPASVQFVPVDFETDTLATALECAGLDMSAPVFFHWLGVVMYLETASAWDCLRFVASLPCPEIVFDYTEPLEKYAPERRAFICKVAERVAQAGEPWLTFFDPKDLSLQLQCLGFAEQEDLGFTEIQGRYGLQSVGPQIGTGVGPHIIRARKKLA